jgi:hypothetical protein
MAAGILRLHTSFLDAAHDLPQDIAKRAWKALYTFSRDPRYPGLHLEKLKGAANLHSIRVSDNYRIIVQQDGPSPTFVYVGPHDKAYGYAERAMPQMAEEGVAEIPVRFQGVRVEEVFQLPEKSVELLLGTVKYLPLAKFLMTRPKSERTVELKFKEIEQIIGEPLPPSARRYAAWWSNEKSETRHVQAHAWMAVGWIVHADRSISKATFDRAS